MITPRLFPTLMPGETIHSAVSRYHLLMGNVSVSSSLTELFGNRATSIASDFPSGLGQLTTLAAGDDLINHHTLLPLFSPFLGSSRSEATRTHMLGRAQKSLKLTCGVMNAGFEGYRAWRYCPECMLQDSLEHGVAYWHVIHQAAGVQACPWHRAPLCTLSVYGEILEGNPLILPRSLEVQANSTQYSFSSTELAKAADVAVLVNWGLTHPTETEQLLSRNFLNFTLRGKGLISHNRIKAARLEHQAVCALRNYPPDDEFGRLGARCQCCPAWILGIIRRQDRTHHPLFYFALLDLLDVGIPDLNAFLIGNELSGNVLPFSGVVTQTRRKVSEELTAKRRALFSADAADGHFRKARGYGWLYRNDRQWLSAYVHSHPYSSPNRRMLDWAVRDAAMSQEIRRARTELLSHPGKPIQITRRSLARHLCTPLSAWRRIDCLPQVATALSLAEESAHDFQLRRVIWASKELDERGRVLTKTSILRQAGIRVLLLNGEELDRCCGCHFFS